MNASLTAGRSRKAAGRRAEINLVVSYDTMSKGQLSGLQKSLQRLVESATIKTGSIELADAIVNETAELIERPRSGGVSLTRDQLDFLVESGSVTLDEYAAAESRVAKGSLLSRAQGTRLNELTDSLSTAEVAELLDIDESRVRHRQGAGSLYSYVVGRNRRYPSWQFSHRTETGLLPGIAKITAALPDDIHPATVRGLMETPQGGLVVNGEPTTPLDWLLSGGDLSTVLDVIEGYRYA